MAFEKINADDTLNQGRIKINNILDAVAENYSNPKEDINNVENHLFDVYNTDEITFSFGRINGDGNSETDYTTRIYTKNFHYAKKGSVVSVNDGYKFNLATYSQPSSNNFINIRNMSSDRYVFETDCFFRMTLAKNNDGEMILSESDNIHFKIIMNSVDIDDMTLITTSSDVIWERGRVNTDGTNDDNIKTRIRTRDYIYCEGGSKITVDNGRFNVIEFERHDTIKDKFKVVGTKSLDSANYVASKSCYIRVSYAPLVDREITYQDFRDVRTNLHMSLFKKKYVADSIVHKSKAKEICNPCFNSYHYAETYYPNIPVNENRLTTLYGMWDELVALYPDFITKDVIGKDATNAYDIVCYTICGNSNTDKLLKVLWIDGIHGHEFNIGSTTYQFARDLLERHYTKDTLGTIWSNCCLKIIPTSNPWGYKNYSRTNGRGVNLNRNFSADWEYIAKDDNNNYSGEEPDTEIETKLIQNFIWNNRDAVFVVNRHDMSSVTDAEKYFGYCIDNFISDKEIFEGFSRKITTDLRKTYNWLNTTEGYAKNPLFFTDYKSNASGTLDKWVNKIGMHGCLLEIASSLGSDFDSSHTEDFSRIHTDITGNMLCCIVQENVKMLSNQEQKYNFLETR